VTIGGTYGATGNRSLGIVAVQERIQAIRSQIGIGNVASWNTTIPGPVTGGNAFTDYLDRATSGATSTATAASTAAAKITATSTPASAAAAGYADAAQDATAILARRDGITIGITDSYRSYEDQVDIAARKGIYGQGGWAAVPGTSNHGWGMALDLDLDDGAQAWMRDNGWRYGFFEDVPGEPWHWTYRSST